MITAIVLQPLPIWKGEEEGHVGVVSRVLKLAVMLSLHRPKNEVEYPGRDENGQLKKNLSNS